MDYRHLVETRQYDPAELRDPFDRGVAAGIEHAIDDLETFLANEYTADDSDPLFERVEASRAGQVVEEAREWLYSTYCQTVVELLDNEAADE